MSRHKPVLLTVVVFILALVASACSGAGERPADSGESAPGFPVRVQHKYGETEVPAPPKRVVTLGLSDHETVLAFGIKPVGAVDWFGERPYGKWPWTNQRWGQDRPEVVGQRDEYNLEQIAKLKPDLILAQYSGMREDQYSKLSAIAPTVAQSPRFDGYKAPWQEMTRMVGRSLGQEKRAEELIGGVEQRFAEVRRNHPEFSEQKLALVDSYKPGVFGAFSPKDSKSMFMRELGFQPAEGLNRMVGDKDVAEFGFEQLHLLDVDRLVWMTSDEASAEAVRSSNLYQRLDVVKQNRDVFLSYQDPPVGAAISFNTVLSIPYAIDQVVPQLAEKTGN